MSDELELGMFEYCNHILVSDKLTNQENNQTFERKWNFVNNILI